MELGQAIANIEYKIATESDNFQEGRTITIDVNSSWPPVNELGDILTRKYPYISLAYHSQANDILQLKIINCPPLD
jgi:hypothetical protein